MMKSALCMMGLCLAVLTAPVCAAVIDVYPGFNCIALPCVPLDPTPESVFSGVALDSNLTRLDSTGGSDVVYSQWAPQDFGNLLLGDGFMLYTDTAATITYNSILGGVRATESSPMTDMWISLSGNQFDANNTDRNGDGIMDGGGWNLLGNPYDVAVNKSLISFTDGTELKTWQEAYDSGWVADNLQGLDGLGGSSFTISLGWGDGDDMLPARGYYMETFKDNIAMIITAPTL